MKIGGRIRLLRQEKGLTLQEVALRVGTDTGNLSRLERNRQGYSQEMLMAIADALDVPMSEFFSSGNAARGPTLKGVPVISYVRAGSWLVLADQPNLDEVEEYRLCPAEHGPNTFAMRVKGISMLGANADESFKDGDLIFVDPGREAHHGAFVVAKLPHQPEATFRRLILEDGRRYLEATNPAWPNKLIELPDKALIIGTVIFHGRDVG